MRCDGGGRNLFMTDITEKLSEGSRFNADGGKQVEEANFLVKMIMSLPLESEL